MAETSDKIPKRILLKGFSAHTRESAVQWLKDRSIDVVNLQTLATHVVAGPDLEPALLKKARLDGPKIITWDEMRALVMASTAEDHSQCNTSENADTDGGGLLSSGRQTTSTR